MAAAPFVWVALTLVFASLAHAQPEFPHDCRYLLVSGAGLDVVNGWYVPSVTYERKLQWCREDERCYSGSRAVYWSVRGYWAVANSDRVYKLTTVSDPDLPVGDVWTPINGARSPAPTVTCHAERDSWPRSCPFVVVQGAGDGDIDGVYEPHKFFNKHRTWRRLNPAEGSVVVYHGLRGWELARGYLPSSPGGTTPLYQEPMPEGGNDVPLPQGWIAHFGKEPAPRFSCQNHPRMPPPGNEPC